MEKYKLSITGKRIYNLEFLESFLDEKIVQLNKLFYMETEVNIYTAIKKVVIQKRRFNNKVDSLIKMETK